MNNLDPAIMAYLARMQYRPGETDMPQYVDPATGQSVFGRYTQGPYGGEGSNPSMTLNGFSMGNYNPASGGQFQVFDQQGQDTGQSEQWKRDTGNYDTEALAAAGLFGGAAALGLGAGGAAGAANGSWDVLPGAAGGAPNTAVMGASGAAGAGGAPALSGYDAAMGDLASSGGLTPASMGGSAGGGLLDGLGLGDLGKAALKYGPGLLGLLAGSKKSPLSKYVYGDGAQKGAFDYASGLLNAPVAPNGFNRFYGKG